jgi:hypothetical protein
MNKIKSNAISMALCLSALLISSACSDEVPKVSEGLVIQSPGSERPYFHDFGVIQDGTRPTHTFRLLNTEETPVTLIDLLPSCSCAVPAIRSVSASGVITRGSTRNVGPACIVPPGGILEIEVAMDTQHIRRKNADRLSTIRLRTNSAVTPFHTLELHVIVEQLVQATPWEINLGEIPTSAGGTRHTIVVPSSLTIEVEVTSTRVISGEGLNASFQEEEELLGRKSWRVNAELSPGLKLGPWNGSIAISISAPTKDPPTRELVVPIRARVVEDVTLRPRRAFLMQSNTAGVEFTVQALIPGARVTVTSAKLSECPEGIFSTSVTPVRPDAKGRSEKWNIRVVRDAAKDGMDINAQLSVTLAGGETLSAALLVR